MKRILYCFLLVLVVAILGITGCQTNTDTNGMEIRLAPIDEVQINIAESFPPQVFVHIIGGLADSCNPITIAVLRSLVSVFFHTLA